MNDRESAQCDQCVRHKIAPLLLTATSGIEDLGLSLSAFRSLHVRQSPFGLAAFSWMMLKSREGCFPTSTCHAPAGLVGARSARKASGPW